MLSKSQLHKYQVETITEMYERDRLQAILPMGAGKTASALTAFAELQEAGEVRKMLVLAPKRVAQLVWTKEHTLWEHLAHLRVSLGLGTPPKRRKMLFWPDPDIKVQTIDNIQWLVKELEPLPDDHPLFDLLVVDESSRLKNPRSKRAKALFKIIDRFRNVWFTTGTPRPNSIIDQFMPMKLLSGGKLWGKSYDVWEQKNFTSDFSGFKKEVIPERGARFEQDIKAYTYAIDPDDMEELPELVTREHWVEMPEDTQVEYAKMEKHLVAELHKLGENVVAANAAVKTAKLEQLCQGFMYRNKIEQALDPDSGTHDRLDSEKLDTVDDLIHGAAGSVLIISWYNAELDELVRRYPKMARIGKGVSDKQVAANEAAWNAGDIDLMAIHPASAGHGLNLQKGGNQFIWCMPIWSAELWDQTRKRIYRQGQKHRCFEHIVCMDPGQNERGRVMLNVDQMKIDRVVNKMTTQDAFVKAMRGLK